MSVNICFTKDYDKKRVFGKRENKANLPTPKGVEQRLDDDHVRDIVVC